jgi:hypothetical protein
LNSSGTSRLFLRALRGQKSFDFRLKQKPLTRSSQEKGREVREEIQTEALPRDASAPLSLTITG